MFRMRAAAAVLCLLAVGAAAPARAATDAPPPAEIKVRVTAAGRYFTDAAGMTLYTYAQDRPGRSACTAECAKTWPPLLAPAAAPAAGPWSTITREDGSAQWAYRGQPLYRYAKDGYAGAAFGDRIGGAWNAAFEPIPRPPGIAVRALAAGRVLTDGRGHTLYTRSDETKDKAGCADAACLAAWPPLSAPLMANPVGEFSALPRPDGTLQWAYRGQRLYLNARDLKPGDMAGEGAGKVWRAVVLDPAPPLPAWVTVQRSDMGEIFADAQGLTLYTFAGSLDKVRQTVCNDACIAKFWRTVPAAPDAAPSGDWLPVTGEGGARVWAYKGNVVYTHTRDKEPGAIGGDKWAAGVGGGGGGWQPIPRRRDLEEQ
jgi:predicted lipoprotein with Yx(FWY)xxD motif